ncbi:NEDD4-binding protein 2-like 2 isoform X4 [Corvus cornix cornix]|uniref:NEDD4-binding protein 2-like 2 isoform X4 n=1 Tax=Corvus cornix cornix TaxID=932674 RepID=UPI0019514CC0|nr:NEDD4-binding protein 2-like 2 isoform X4 [Corvus cornix cornix]
MMLLAENTVRLLDHQDEIRIEPSSKRMKSTEGACEKLPDVDNKGTQEKVDVEKKSNGCIPLCALDKQGQHEMQNQEEILTGVLGSLNEVLPENNPVLCKPVDLETVQNVNPPFASINDSKAEEEKGPFITNNAGEDNIEKSSTLFSVNRNESDEDFFTSKDFIGPIYKPAKSNKKDKSGNCCGCRNNEGDENELYENRSKRKEAKKMQAVSAAVPEIDDELDQFYKEIHQLENENSDANLQEKETEISQEQHSPFSCSQSSEENSQPVLLGSPQPFYENGQCFSGEQNSQKTSKEQQSVVETGGWKTENTFNGQVDAWNCSVPEFRPAWQTSASFRKPQGSLPPRFNHQSHFQILNSLPQIQNTLSSQNGGLSYENFHCYHENTDINSRGPLLDQNTDYSGHMDIHSTQVFRNGSNDQNGLQSNGFCETREECWKGSKADSREGMHSFSSLQLSEERFSCSRKLLLILRGLPGSGKSTLSRALLGQSCDGIVLSTDDYFRQQYGYTYNAAQLGDAHEWNQKRAKQAMEQGKSPVIIDNTNTQAWEMKPYVEVALEKGYRVEFREPDTWWKFDPEELEKRNKHGVTREKIAQMLERYEYQISIPIVMNSVVPPHKNTQRPPLQRRHREAILSKNPGYLLTKAKQKKKRKRNKTMKSNRTEITKKMLCGVAHHPIPGDHDGSESEEDDLEEENKKSLCTFSKDPEDPVAVCEEQSKSGDESLKEASGVSRESFLVTVPEVSVMSNSAWKNELPVESDSLLLRDVKPFCTENLTKNALDDEEANQRHKDSLCSFLKISSDKNSIQETEGISEDYGMSLLSTENKLRSCQITCEPDLEAKLVSLNSEEEISQCYNSSVLDNVPDNTEGKGALKAEETSSSAWAFFSISLSTEELQMGFNTQMSLSPYSEDKFVGEQRPQKVMKPEQTHTNSSAKLNCYQSSEGLVKENHHETETEETGNVISNGLSASPTGKVHFDSRGEARATFTQGSSEVNVPINDATPITLKRKRYRRIVNLAPKFNLPRQIAGHTEGGKEVPIREDIPQESVFEVRQKNFLSKNCGEAHEQDHSLQEYSLPTPDADALLHNISYVHSGQCSPILKCAFKVCVDSKTKEEQATTFQPQQEKQKTNGLQNGDGLTDDILSLEDLNKNHQGNQDSPETLSDMELCQDVIEENIITCTGTGCLDAAFHQS